MKWSAMISAAFCLVILILVPVSAWPLVLDAGISEGPGYIIREGKDIGERKDTWETGQWETGKEIVGWIRIAPNADINPTDLGHQFAYEPRLIRPDGTVFEDLVFPEGFLNDGYGVDTWFVSSLMKEPGWEGQWTCEYYLYDDYAEKYQLARTLHFTLLPHTATATAPGTSAVASPAQVNPAGTLAAAPAPASAASARAPLEWIIPVIAAGCAVALASMKKN